eukprot:6611399-Prymnesium_polylepis.1
MEVADFVVDVPVFSDSDDDADVALPSLAEPGTAAVKQLCPVVSDHAGCAFDVQEIREECRARCAFDVQEIHGRGRGLVALRSIAPGEHLGAFAAYSHTAYEFDERQHSYPSLFSADSSAQGDAPSQCCST